MLQRFGGSLVVLLCVFAAACQPIGTDEIPLRKPENWVVDLAGLLSAEQVAELESLGEAVHRRGGAALSVVTLDSTGGENPRQLANDVFNRWQLGDRDRDNGLLILVAIEDRAVEIVLGDGIDSDAEVAKSDFILQQRMLPHFRENRGAAAILAGAHACAEEFFGVGAAASTAAAAPQLLEAPPAPPRPIHPRPFRKPEPVAVVILSCLGLGLGLLGFGRWNRHRPRTCKTCRKKMVRLGEAEDDAHLEAGQKTEEKVGSVDYDVWYCEGCAEVEKIAYGTFLSGHARCSQCRHKTATKIEKTLRFATLSTTGLMEIKTRCAHCDHESIATRTLPRLRPPSSGSSGRSFSSGSSGRSSGGGSSSGRGSSGRW